jgi:hypothetical protein
MNMWEFCHKHFVGLCIVWIASLILLHDTLMIFR